MFRARIEQDPRNLIEFLARVRYPHPWTLESLKDQSIVIRIEDAQGFTKAYVWALWSRDFPEALDFHGASLGRLWLSTELMSKLATLADLLGARQLVTLPAGPTEATIRSLLIRRGYREEGGYLVKDL